MKLQSLFKNILLKLRGKTLLGKSFEVNFVKIIEKSFEKIFETL